MPVRQPAAQRPGDTLSERVGGRTSTGAASENEQVRKRVAAEAVGTVHAAGDLAGKLICTVHLADGTAIVAGSGVLARGFWDTDGKRICRRDALDPPSQRHCVEYQRLGNNRYRNSDGVEFCIGPC